MCSLRVYMKFVSSLLKIPDKFRTPQIVRNYIRNQGGFCHPDFIRSSPELVRSTSSELESVFNPIWSDISTVRRTLSIRILFEYIGNLSGPTFLPNRKLSGIIWNQGVFCHLDFIWSSPEEFLSLVRNDPSAKNFGQISDSDTVRFAIRCFFPPNFIRSCPIFVRFASSKL